MTEHQTRQLHLLHKVWERKTKDGNYLWQVTSTIKNTIMYVLMGKADLQQLEDVLIKAKNSAKGLAIQVYYESALDDVKTIIAGGSIEVQNKK
jgi:hypothetical protein